MKTTKAEEEALKEIVIKICGKVAVIIVPILKDKSNVDEFKIANRAKMTINELRNILYKLHHRDLVSFTRKKDKKKGWFIYYWTLNKGRALRSLEKDYQRDLELKKDILDNTMKKNYFICPRGHTELSEESSLEQNFECMECGELLVLKDRETEKRRINRSIGKINIKLDELKELLVKYIPKVFVEVKKKRAKKPKKPKAKEEKAEKGKKEDKKVKRAIKEKKLRERPKKDKKKARVKAKPKRNKVRVKGKAKKKKKRR